MAIHTLPDRIFTLDEEFLVTTIRHQTVKPHMHEFFELVYVLNGSADHISGDVCVSVKPGDYFIIDYHTPHQYVCEDGQELELLTVLFKPSFIDKVLEDCIDFRQLLSHYLIRFQHIHFEHSPTDYVFHDNDGHIRNLMDTMVAEASRVGYGYVEIIRSVLIQVIVHILRSIANGVESIQQRMCTQQIVEYLNVHYTEDITLTQISKRLNYSLPYLSKQFHMDTGIPFHRYLQKLRIEHSCRLLANTGKKISEVAEAVGYCDMKYFQTVFKKLMGCTPKTYQKQFRNC